MNLNPNAYWTSQRPAYTPDAKCPKCGSKRITDRYVTFHYIGLGEAVRRICANCDHLWDERPLDA